MLWLIGGKKETGETNEIWSGTPSGTGWIKIDVKGNNIWDARMQHSAATCNGLLFVFGGKKRTSATTQEYFYSSDPFSNLKGSDVWISNSISNNYIGICFYLYEMFFPVEELI